MNVNTCWSEHSWNHVSLLKSPGGANASPGFLRAPYYASCDLGVSNDRALDMGGCFGTCG